MQTIEALQRGAWTWLVHNFGNVLDGEDRFVVGRFKVCSHGPVADLARWTRHGARDPRYGKTADARAFTTASWPGSQAMPTS